MAEYRLFVEKMYDRTCGFYETYGISVCENGIPTRIVKDISLDDQKVSSLVRAFNDEQLDPAHLNQAVEDYLYDLNS